MYNTWNSYFMAMARLVAEKSKDESTKVGVVIVGPDHAVRSTGYNGFPRKIDELPEERWERPEKYKWVEHAERNAIYNAARNGVSLNGCVAYMEAPPCTECARALIQVGIKELVLSTNNKFSSREDWKESMDFALKMLKEAGVWVIWTNL